MTTIENDDRKQYAVLYAQSGYGADGDPTWGAAAEIQVRRNRRKVNNFSTEESPHGIVSTMRVNAEIAIGSKVWFGRLADLPDSFDAGTLYEVIDYSETPDIKDRYYTRRVTLRRML